MLSRAWAEGESLRTARGALTKAGVLSRDLLPTSPAPLVTPVSQAGPGARQGWSRALTRVTEGSLPTHRGSGWENCGLAPSNRARGSTGAGWHLSSGTRVPVTCRSHTRRLNVKFRLGKSPTSHTALEETCTQSTRISRSPQGPRAESCPAQGRELSLLGLEERWLSGTAVLQERHRASHKPCQYRDFPAEISDSGEESNILGAQKDPGTPQPQEQPLQSSQCFLTPALFHRPVSLPEQVMGADTWR